MCARAICMNGHRASCILRDRRRGQGPRRNAVTAGSRKRFNRQTGLKREAPGGAGEIQNFAKTPCTGQEALTYFFASDRLYRSIRRFIDMDSHAS
ncbi:hypothetical protein EMIT0324P_30209 [Pseudomonas chlororaphis]